MRSFVLVAVAFVGLLLDLLPAAVAAAPGDRSQSAVEAHLRARVAVDGRAASSSLTDRMRHYEVPGVAIAVIRDGRISWAAGYGTRLAGAALPITPDTPFRVASISKPLTGLLAMRLAATGRLDLDRDVNGYLSSWKLPKGTGVTTRRILSHTAGLSVSAFPYYHPPGPIPNVRDLLDGAPVSRAPPVRVIEKPGKSFRYSGGGFLVLQQAIEDTTATPFADLAERQLFRSLGMKRTTFAADPSPAYLRSAAVGHRYGKAIAGGRTVTPNMAGEGLWTTVRDLAAYTSAVRDAYLGRRPDLLSKSGAQEMLTPARFNDGKAGFMGLGPGVLGKGAERRFVANGNGLGFRARITMYLDSGDGVVILSNGDGAEALNGEIADAVARVHGWPVQPKAPIVRRTRAPDRQELALVAGTYVIPANADTDPKAVRVEAIASGLRVQVGNEAWWTYLPDAEGGFFNVDMDSRIRFAPYHGGRFALLLNHLGDDFPIAPKTP